MTENEVAQEIGRRIRHWRTSSPPPKTRRKRQNETGWRPHLTIEELAKATGLTVTTVNKLELGYKSPRIESLLLLAQAFGCEPSELLPRQAPQLGQGRAARRARHRSVVSSAPSSCAS
jgi:transcriptional regulator with XRE-family HTH domain